MTHMILDNVPLDNVPRGARVAIAMSGGVDSSVAAALVHEAGYEAVGLTLQLYDYGAFAGKKGACCAGQDIYDARTSADIIGIPHYVLDYEGRFRERVIDDFADTYLQGATPVPCVRCNQRVKFADMPAAARAMGCAALVTGHYARRIVTEQGVELHAGVDPRRDQSYFLYATEQAQLNYIHFPLGGMADKADVRALAARFNLPTASKPDSQDICFVPDGNYADTVRKLRPDAVRPGEVVHIDGRVLGRHEGVINFTIGQRRGLGIAAGEPLFVVRIDAAERRVIVGPESALYVNDVHVDEVNLLLHACEQADAASPSGLPIRVRVRSTRPATPARLHLTDGGAFIKTETPEKAVAPGQAAVFYAHTSDRVLGGGRIITKVPSTLFGTTFASARPEVTTWI